MYKKRNDIKIFMYLILTYLDFGSDIAFIFIVYKDSQYFPYLEIFIIIIVLISAICLERYQ